jgi:hypothetical protein
MRVPAVTASGAGLLASAVALRWSRPDLTAALAEHVGEVRAGDDRTWVAAAGWLVHGRAAIGDGRQCASDALAEIARRGQGLLDDPAADRLRIEIATLAAGQCEPAVARSLVAPVLAADRSADVRADAYGVLARCVMEERPATIGEATRRAEVAWGEMGGADADIASASLALISAAALRRSGHPDSAVDHAAEGLARLDDIRAAQEGAPSRHLAAALAAEWITALVEAGRTDDAREACAPMAQQLRKTARPTRQIALLRLAVARAVADSAPAAAVEALEQAAQDAAACDTPDLEGLCLSTLGALREQAGRLDAALDSMRRGVAAQRRDRARSERFREALRSMSVAAPAVRTEAVVAPLNRIERSMSKPTRAHAPSAAVAAEENAAVAVHPLADARAADPWSSGSWVDRSAGAVATTRNGRRRRPGRATGSSLGLAEVDVPLVTATGDNAARLGFDSGAGTRPDVGVVRGESSGDEAGADVVASRSSPDGSAGGGDVAAAGGRHAGGAGRDNPSPIMGSAAPGPATPQFHASEPAGHVAPDPLFGPIEHLAEVANPTIRVDPPTNPKPGRGGIEDIPVVHEERPAHASYDGERWLEAALAELDRVWGQPLPDLDASLDPCAEPEAVAAVEPSAGGQASGESVGKGGPATSATVEPLASAATSDGFVRIRQASTSPVAADAGAKTRAADGPAGNGLVA